MPNARVATSGISGRGGSDVPRWVGGNDSFTKLMLHCDGLDATVTDESGSSHTVLVAGGATQVKTNKKFGRKSIELDGVDSFLEVSVPVTDFEFGISEEWDIDFRVSFTDDSTVKDQYILAKGDFPTVGYALYYTKADGKIHLIVDGVNEMEFVWTFNADQWYHFALVGDGSNIKAYVDGVEKASITQVAMG